MQHVLITGASSGLGAALAEAYARNGDRLFLFGRDAHRLCAVRVTCEGFGVEVSTVSCDVTDRDRMRHEIERIDDDAPLDIVIANAGIGGKDVLAGESGEPDDLTYRVFDVNLLGVVNALQPVINRFAARRSGHLVVVSSTAGIQGVGEAPSYSASKAAVRVYGESLRRMLAHRLINVTIVTPGFINTPMSASLPYDTPFAVSPQWAAQRICRGIARREKEIIFPWQFRVLTYIGHLLPIGIVDRLLAFGQRWAAKN